MRLIRKLKHRAVTHTADKLPCLDLTADLDTLGKRLIKMVRQSVASYIEQMYDDGEDIPELDSLSSDGLAWDWMKPCYYQRLTYQCITNTEE